MGEGREQQGCRKNEEKAPENRHRKREAEETDKVKVVPRVTVASLRFLRVAIVGPTQGLSKRSWLCRKRTLKPCEYGVVDAMLLGANAR